MALTIDDLATRVSDLAASVARIEGRTEKLPSLLSISLAFFTLLIAGLGLNVGVTTWSVDNVVEARFRTVDLQIARIDERLTRIEGRMDGMGEQLATIERLIMADNSEPTRNRFNALATYDVEEQDKLAAFLAPALSKAAEEFVAIDGYPDNLAIWETIFVQIGNAQKWREIERTLEFARQITPQDEVEKFARALWSVGDDYEPELRAILSATLVSAGFSFESFAN